MKKKIMSLLLAIIMMVSVMAPVALAEEVEEGSGNGGTPTDTTNVVVHKILMNKTEMGNHDADKKYNPATGIPVAEYGEFFGDASAKEIKDVYFVAISNNEIQPKAGAVATLTEAEDYFKSLTTDQIKVKETEKAGLTKEVEGKVEGLSLTLENGTEGNDLKWFIFEVKELSTYKGENKELLADSKAVPIEITLPMSNENGKMDKVHVYPKNTQDKPKIDKDFENANANEPGIKAKRDYSIGDKVPFHVQTIIPQDAKYKTLKWTDQMSKGLTFNNDIVIKTTPEINLIAGDYSVDARPDGFTLILKDSGLTKVVNEAKNSAVTIDINYTATLNSEVEIEKLENNKVKLHYGNSPTDENEPPEITKTTQISVSKNWADGDAPAGITVTYVLYEKVDLGEGKFGWKEKERVKPASPYSHTFEGLVTTKTYKVVEIVDGYTPEYSYKAEEGEAQGLTITNNKKPDNPDPLEPTPPTVTTYGKKFVKTNDKTGEDLLRLQGAEFVVKNAQSKYLAMKPDAQKQKENDTYIALEEAYQKAVNDYNQAVEEGKPEEDLETLKAEIEPAKRARDKALIDATHHYYWTAEIDEAHVLISDAQGRFEIKGLAAGTYNLEEIKAPEGYAKLSKDVPFTVGSGTYAGTAEEMEYTPNTPADGYGQQVSNTKVTIPQTGGMGTIILTVAGIALMATAVIALRRNRAADRD